MKTDLQKFKEIVTTIKEIIYGEVVKPKKRKRGRPRKKK